MNYMAQIVVGIMVLYTCRWSLSLMQYPGWRGWVYPIPSSAAFWALLNLYAYLRGVS